MGTSSTELTPREQEVLDLARRGYTNNEIADRLGITRNAVRFHLKEVHSKLGTGGDRSALARGWSRGLGLLTFPVAKFGVPATVATFAAGLTLGGFAAYRALPGGDAVAAPDRFEGAVLVDGRYPNGCPAEFYAGTMTLADFAYGQTTLEELQALNPDLPLGHLAPETIVRVPYDPTGECGEAVATPPGSPRQFGTPPAGK
jgi:DNA-binding CsgD family transcriptional regulator